jgi:hypothetical protein
VSLRREFHSAFDQIAPPLGGMPERVVQTVLAEHKARRRKERMLFRLRTPLSLVAVFVLIAVIAAVLVGGRLVQDWNAFHKPVPAGQPHASLATLEARPLQLPQVAAAAACPNGPQSSTGVYGNGPFYGDSTIAQGPSRSQWGLYWYLEAETDRNVSGLMLVRAIDVKTKQQYVFAGQYAAGPVVGTDALGTQSIQQHSELVLDTSHRPTTTYKGRTTWPFQLGVPKGNSGCYGWQIDGDNFTETFVFDAGITS